ncbi:hypothetical protein [Klebsiella oxytoca]|uniref:hypothetical protein n=1 Tax=Klebsiella oxytoca TaxID=571 RepID=UPI00157A93EB|nr:hypothetical protein [Klebsiella oxytoca]
MSRETKNETEKKDNMLHADLRRKKISGSNGRFIIVLNRRSNRRFYFLAKITGK